MTASNEFAKCFEVNPEWWNPTEQHNEISPEGIRIVRKFVIGWLPHVGGVVILPCGRVDPKSINMPCVYKSSSDKLKLSDALKEIRAAWAKEGIKLPRKP